MSIVGDYAKKGLIAGIVIGAVIGLVTNPFTLIFAAVMWGAIGAAAGALIGVLKEKNNAKLAAQVMQQSAAANVPAMEQGVSLQQEPESPQQNQTQFRDMVTSSRQQQTVMGR